jgi:hypothetical protein
MGVAVTFNYDAWRTRFPEFSTTVDLNKANELFAEAEIYHRNDGGGPVPTANAQTILLNYIVAHLAKLYFGTNEDHQHSGPSLVGRINNANQGSVGVQANMDLPAGSAQWWNQTQYGASYWLLTSVYRTMHYAPGPRRQFMPSIRGLAPWTGGGYY